MFCGNKNVLMHFLHMKLLKEMFRRCIFADDQVTSLTTCVGSAAALSRVELVLAPGPAGLHHSPHGMPIPWGWTNNTGDQRSVVHHTLGLGSGCH